MHRPNGRQLMGAGPHSRLDGCLPGTGQGRLVSALRGIVARVSICGSRAMREVLADPLAVGINHQFAILLGKGAGRQAIQKV